MDREALSGQSLYPEWDMRTGAYLPAHARVLHAPLTATEATPAFRSDPAAAARIRAVRRQFEALRPARISTPATPTGMSWIPTAPCARRSICGPAAKAPTGSGARPARKTAALPCRSCWMCRDQPKA
ncbi:hypothetical protein ACFSHQ_01525 [Gemmobacter lanyuensis]